MSFKDFDIDRVRLDKNEVGPVFGLGGQKFECLPRLPAIAQQKLTQMANIGGEKVALPDVIEMIRSAIVRRKWKAGDDVRDEAGALVSETGVWESVDDLQRFDALLNDPDEIIESELLGEIVQWLMEQYGGNRPTSRSRRS